MMSLSANLKQKQLLCGFIPSKSFLQVSLCHIVYHYPRALPLLGPPGRGVAIILFTTDLTDLTDKCPVSARSKTKTGKTPWRGWRALPLLLYFRLGLIRASS